MRPASRASGLLVSLASINGTDFLLTSPHQRDNGTALSKERESCPVDPYNGTASETPFCPVGPVDSWDGISSPSELGFASLAASFLRRPFTSDFDIFFPL